MTRKASIGAAVLILCLGISTRAQPPAQPEAASRLRLSNLRLNPVNGLVQVDATLLAPPLPKLDNISGRVRVTLKAGAANEESVTASVGTINLKRTVNSTRPFPCNETLPVVATVVAPADIAGHTLTATLTRKCSAAQGTPDLTVKEVRRTDGGGLNSPRETPIEITVVVKNIAAYALPFNEQGGTPWQVQVTPGVAPASRSFALPLQGNGEHRFTIKPIALPCGRESDVTVVVDLKKVILESDETNNTKVFKVAGNRCQDADEN